jgi:hypothetical protein
MQVGAYFAHIAIRLAIGRAGLPPQIVGKRYLNDWSLATLKLQPNRSRQSRNS